MKVKDDIKHWMIDYSRLDSDNRNTLKSSEYCIGTNENKARKQFEDSHWKDISEITITKIASFSIA